MNPSSTVLPDIRSRQDVMQMVRSFYDKARADELLGPVFAPVDFEKHLPVIDEFWCMILVSEGNYARNAFDRHLGLGLKAEHFDRWLTIFKDNIDQQFSGETATMAKQRAESISWIFRTKLGL